MAAWTLTGLATYAADWQQAGVWLPAVSSVAAAFSLGLIGRRPFAAAALSWLVLSYSVASGNLSWQVTALGVLGTFGVAALGGSRTIVAHLAVTTACLVALGLTWPEGPYGTVGATLALAFAIGLITRYHIVGAEMDQRRHQELHSQIRTLQRLDRHELAQDLHDAVASELTLVSLNVSAASESVESEETRSAMAAAQLAALGALTQLSSLVATLEDRPLSGVDDQTSQPTLAGVLNDAEHSLKRAGFEVQVSRRPRADLEDLEPRVSQAAVRVVREGMLNVLKHGRTGSTCSLDVSRTGEHLEIQFRNEVGTGGRGAPGIGNGLGLESMKRRVKLRGGSISYGAIGGEWLLRVELPLSLIGDESRPNEPQFATADQ